LPDGEEISLERQVGPDWEELGECCSVELWLQFKRHRATQLVKQGSDRMKLLFYKDSHDIMGNTF